MRIQKNKRINHLGGLNISADIVSFSSHADEINKILAEKEPFDV